MSPPKNRPPVAKGVRFPFQVSIAAWGDLLGYGKKIAESKFNPLDDRAKESIRRIQCDGSEARPLAQVSYNIT